MSVQQRKALVVFRGLVLSAVLTGTVSIAWSQDAVRAAHIESPHYPENARDAGVQGEVRVSARVASDGTIIDVDAKADKKILREAALTNFKKWTFEPATSGSREFNVTYQFALREKMDPRPDEEVMIDQEIPRRIRIEANPSPLANDVPGFQISRADEIHYPTLARQTGIAGTVKLFVVIDRAGRVFEVDVESGHPLLVAAAVESIQKWKADPPGDGPREFHISYEFELREKVNQEPDEKVTVDLPRSVRVEVNAPLCDHCPQLSKKN